MTNQTRRDVMRALALAGGSLAAGSAFAAPAMLKLDDIKKEGTVACLYHCDYNDAARFNQTLNNISNHYSVYSGNPFDIQLVLVAHSGAVRFFLKDQENTPWKDQPVPEDVFTRMESLSKNGLRAYLCDITFTRLKLDRGKIRQADFVDMVPSGVATVAALQAKGFAYLKVG
ncbi:MAG: DsrE family protein [Rhodomicrobiaceae bacterium]